MTLPLYRAARNQGLLSRVKTVDERNREDDIWGRPGGKFRIPNSEFPYGEELPQGSLNPGDSYKKVGIMVGIIGRSILDGGRQSAHTRWVCRQPLKPSGLPRNETSRDSRLITTWRYIHTQSACQVFGTFCGVQGVRMAPHGAAMSAESNREA